MYKTSALQAALPIFVILLAGTVDVNRDNSSLARVQKLDIILFLYNLILDSKSSADAYPHGVQVQSPPGNYRCAGALVAPSIVLTSAHCVNGFRPEGLAIVMRTSGNVNIAEPTMSVQNVVLHDNFNDTTLENDIAIIILEHDVLKTRDVLNASIPTENENFHGNVTLIGWMPKKTLLNTFTDHTPAEAIISIVPCSVNASLNQPHLLCAEAVENVICPGEWAGYLACSRENIHNYICGIFSSGNGCEGDRFVFTKVAVFSRWIRSRILGQSSEHQTGIYDSNKTLGESPGCGANRFQCSVSKKCIKMTAICDGAYNCGRDSADFSDEKDCKAVNGCHPTQFACRRGNKCLPGRKRCDGRADCYDFSDEDDCPFIRSGNCTFKEFTCNITKKCIPQNYICDGVPDCGTSDLSDEENCKVANGCHPSQFACHIGNKCIPGYQICDGTSQCNADDNSDEEHCKTNDQVENTACNLRNLACNGTNGCYSMADICDDIPDCSEYGVDDEANCTTGVNHCKWNQFACRSSRQCIPVYNVCDGKEHCKDGSDEQNCTDARTCHWTQFACLKESKCIAGNLRCDGTKDCSDGMDEDNCDDATRCHWSQFRCWDTGECIPGHFVCDGENQCKDGSDEFTCSLFGEMHCDVSELPCGTTGRCYTLTDICDNSNDCGKGDTSDESNCTAGINGCPWSHFSCRFQRGCVQGHLKCDNDSDCVDGSDEENCNDGSGCHWTQFFCRSDRKCIRGSLRCDGKQDCADGSDEDECDDPSRCRWYEFPCADRSACIRGQFKCDGKTQCHDGSDEDDCGEDRPPSIHPGTLLGYLAIPSGIVVLLGLLLILLYRKYRLQSGRLSEMEIKLFEKGDQSQFKDDKFAHENAQFIPYNRKYETKWKDFKISDDDMLGEGAYGVVFKGHLTVNPSSTIAVKTVKGKVDKTVLLALLAELKVMIHLGKHENVVELVGACTEFLREGRAYVLVEYCPMGSLESYLREMNKKSFRDSLVHVKETNGAQKLQIEKHDDQLLPLCHQDMVNWAAQISHGMQHLQDKKVIHGDLATRNVLLCSKEHVKITDFGLSRQLLNYDNYVKKTQTMLPWRWLAPETLKSMVFTHKTDVWAYGVTMWEIFSLGMVPYPGMGWTADFVYFLEQNQRLSRPKYASEDIFGIMVHCWHSDPDRRPNFKQIESMLWATHGNLVPSADYVEVTSV